MNTKHRQAEHLRDGGYGHVYGYGHNCALVSCFSCHSKWSKNPSFQSFFSLRLTRFFDTKKIFFFAACSLWEAWFKARLTDVHCGTCSTEDAPLPVATEAAPEGWHRPCARCGGIHLVQSVWFPRGVHCPSGFWEKHAFIIDPPSPHSSSFPFSPIRNTNP